MKAGAAAAALADMMLGVKAASRSGLKSGPDPR